MGFGLAFGERVILADVNFEIERPGVTVLMGPAGGGKSTLLRALAGMHARAPRCHRWGSGEYAGADLESVGAPPALVQQHARVLGARAIDNLVAPLRARSAGTPAELRAQVVTELEVLGLEALIPQVDSLTVDLPPQWQRAVMILHQAWSQPRLLMIDEPTYGLSDEAAAVVLDLIVKLGHEMACLVVLHHQRQARWIGDRILLLAGGRVVADANREAFFENARQDPVVAQFIRTGSCSVPSPDASPESLDESVPPPPPLPPEAVHEMEMATAELTTEPAESAPVVLPSPAEVIQALSPVASQAVALGDAGKHVSAEQLATPMSWAEGSVATVAEPSLTPLPRATVEHPALGLPDAPSAAPVQSYLAPRGFRWIVPGRLAGCPMPGAMAPLDHDLTLLRGAGVSLLVNLTNTRLDAPALERFGLRELHFPMEDGRAAPVMLAKMLVVKLQRLLHGGEVIAVHCYAGLGRTGTVLAAWLIMNGLSAEASLERLRKIDRGFVQSREQESMLHELETNLLVRAK